MKKMIGFFQKIMFALFLFNVGNVFADDCISPLVQLTDLNICEGESVRLDASIYQADSYEWTSSEDCCTAKYGAILLVRPDVTTLYYVSMKRGNCTINDEVLVTVNSNPRISRIDSIDVNARQIIADDYGTRPFLYGVDDRPLTSDSRIFDLESGIHSFYIVDSYGCRSASYGYIITLSVSDVTNSPIKIYPIPFTDKLEIQKAANYNLTVTDVQGSILYQRSNLTDNETISTAGWAAGVYLINLSSLDNNVVRKVVKY